MPAPTPPPFAAPTVEQICRILGDAVLGSQIPNLIAPLKAPEAPLNQQHTKWKRPFNAVATIQSQQARLAILSRAALLPDKLSLTRPISDRRLGALDSDARRACGSARIIQSCAGWPIGVGRRR